MRRILKSVDLIELQERVHLIFILHSAECDMLLELMEYNPHQAGL